MRRRKRKSHKEHEKDTDAVKETREAKRKIYDKEDMSYWRKDRKLTKRGMDMEILKMKKEPEMEEKRRITNWKRGEKIE